MLVRLLFSQYPAKTIKLWREVNACRLYRLLPLFVGEVILMVFFCLLLFGWVFFKCNGQII